MDANDQTSSRVSTYLIEDGSYFRIKNIQLTYNFDDTINSLLGIAGGQVYLQAQNFITITDYSGLNPEVQTGADTTMGFDGGYYPVSKTITTEAGIYHDWFSDFYITLGDEIENVWFTQPKSPAFGLKLPA